LAGLSRQKTLKAERKDFGDFGEVVVVIRWNRHIPNLHSNEQIE
jgi:hypothetical protein